MTRRTARLALVLVAAGALLAGLATLGEAQRQTPRANLVLLATSEPPSTTEPGRPITLTYTAANQGRRSSGRAVQIAVLLSRDQVRSNDDIKVPETDRVASLARGRQLTDAFRVTPPADAPRELYYLIVCIDRPNRVRESSEGDNCRPSGQKLGLGTSERAPVGTDGPPGADGPPGKDAIGPDGTRFRPIERTTLDLGNADPSILAAFPKANGQRPKDDQTPDEGSNQTRELARIGPLTLRALCRRTTNGDNQPPATAPVDGQEASFDGDGDEAKILVVTGEGTYSMHSSVGPRMNVPAGEGTPGEDGEGGGEGKHMALAVSRDPDPDTTSSGSSGPGANPALAQEKRVAFGHSDAYIVHSGGMELILHLYAGIDVLDVGGRCVFGGAVEVVKP